MLLLLLEAKMKLMRRLLIISFLLISWSTYSQTVNLSGTVLNETGEPLMYATAVLLDPADSTLKFYGITDENGQFEIRDIKDGDYLLQIAFLGYETYYSNLNIPSGLENIPDVIIMKEKKVTLDEVNIVSERIPLQIKRDTIEYNASAFKTKPDASAEDLLKKLPGVEVDRSGNIKALGEDVKNVYVDGKEFFGNDPTVATRNLPADALNKVQVFDKHSDESEFTGIDDGIRDKSVNLVLKDDKKQGVFGDIMAGGGTGEHYQGNAKVYRFTGKTQMAALAMLNNVNQYGFSLNDYMNFSGGISALASEGGMIRLGDESGFPVNFGQPVSGHTTSGAGGFNYSFSKEKYKRVFFSYLVNSSKKELEETVKSWNYTPDGSFVENRFSESIRKNTTHRLNFGWRNRIDSLQNIIMNGNLSLLNGSAPSFSRIRSLLNDTLINTLHTDNENESERLSGNISGSYQKRINKNKTVLKLAADASFSRDISKIKYQNDLKYFDSPEEITTSQFQNNTLNYLNYAASLSAIQKISGTIFIKPGIRTGQSKESIEQTQGIPGPGEVIIDSLSPDFDKYYDWVRPSLVFRHNTKKTRFTASLKMELGRMRNSLWNDPYVEKKNSYFTPALSFAYDYKTGKRLSFNYSADVTTPTVNQLLPVVNNINPLAMAYGNRYLEPEYNQRLNMHWLFFDQFSFTSVISGISARYTKNKINWSRTIDQNLVQNITPVNVKDDYYVQGSIDFSTPIRKLGIKINTSFREGFNRGINIINDVENTTTNWSHRFSLTIDNRKKDKWDLITGATLQYTDARYSVQESLNNKYFNLSWFGEIHYTPSDSWNFSLTADITNYYAESFDKEISIPLLGAEINYYCLKNKRGVFTLYAFDLLDKNTGVQRISEMNYLMEKQSNTIGRYVMFSFKYRLNKMGGNKSGVHLELKRR